MTMNAAAVLLANGEARHAALACGAESVDYGELRDTVARAAGVLRQRGLAEGDRVAVKLPDGLPWVSAFLGAMWAGGVGVAVNPRIPADEWEYVVGEGDFRWIVAESADDAPAAVRDRVLTVEQWLADLAAASPVEPASMSPDAPAFWTHSSGSSGRPKAVIQAHRFALHVERVAAELLGVTAGDRLFASSKLFFSYPLGNSLFSGLKLGATVILDPQWPTAQSVEATVEAQRPTVLFSVPSLYRNMLKGGFARRLARQGLRACVSAGEALPSSLREEWRRETGVTIVNGYGASETLSLVLLNLGEGEDLAPAPGVEISAAGGGGRELPTRIRITMPALALGYWRRPDADAESFRDGAYCPADLFTHTAAGRWRFVGRDDAVVKIHGRWVNLVELEERLAVACPAIVEAAATTVPDADGVDAVAFFYVLREDAPLDADLTLRAQVDALPPYRRPRWLHPLESLPRTPTGKLLRRKLKELHQTLDPQQP